MCLLKIAEILMFYNSVFFSSSLLCGCKNENRSQWNTIEQMGLGLFFIYTEHPKTLQLRATKYRRSLNSRKRNLSRPSHLFSCEKCLATCNSAVTPKLFLDFYAKIPVVGRLKKYLVLRESLSPKRLLSLSLHYYYFLFFSSFHFT